MCKAQGGEDRMIERTFTRNHLPMLLFFLILLLAPLAVGGGEARGDVVCGEWRAIGRGLLRDAAVSDGSELVAEDRGTSLVQDVVIIRKYLEEWMFQSLLPCLRSEAGVVEKHCGI